MRMEKLYKRSPLRTVQGATRMKSTVKTQPRIGQVGRRRRKKVPAPETLLRVEWLTDVTAVRKKATAEDKPIVILYTGGAGYNEPLGVC